VRVLTWNVWWRFGDWRARRTAIEAVLARESPDVICLQEVWKDGREHLAEQLARPLGFHVAEAPSPRSERWQRRLGEPGVAYGLAVLSRWPIVGREVLHLPPVDEPDEGRLALRVLLDAGAVRMCVTTTQLNSAPHHSAIRVAQVRALAEFVAAGAANATYPAVLTGDFNAVPDADEIRLLEGFRTAPHVPGQVLVDAWRYAPPGDPGLTWDAHRNPDVRETLEPSGRIDFVFVAPPSGDGAGHVRRVGLVGDAPEDGIWPSDHFGVVVDLVDPASPEL